MPEHDADPTISQLIAEGAFVFSDIATRSPKMTECLRRARAASKATVTVLITGETGTGKTGLAHAIHNASDREGGPCLVVNCSALSEALLESELFGHEKGAFTGADRLKRGKFELADGGTLILDEAGDLSSAAQAKILRAVEYRKFERVGGEETLGSNVRIIALSNQHIPDLIAEGAFREDLYFRFREMAIEMPPLRERPEDIDYLVDLFVSECAAKFGKPVLGCTRAAMEAVRACSWPGNVRQLKAALKQAVVLAEGDSVDVGDLPQDVIGAGPGAAAPALRLDDDLTLQTVERRHIRAVLELCDGNRTRAAERLGIHYTTLLRKLEQMTEDDA